MEVRVVNVTLEVSAFARQAVGGDDLMKADLLIVDFDVPNTHLVATRITTFSMSSTTRAVCPSRCGCITR